MVYTLQYKHMKNEVVHFPNILLAHLLQEEKKRNVSLEDRYRKAVDELPKGNPFIRKKGRGGKAYLYLNRRFPDQKYPESKYIGPIDSDRAKKLHEQLADRGKLEAQLEVLKIERRMIEKALNEYRRAHRILP